MISVEKRRTGRKSGRRRKHSNGALSDASSTGSFLDETDREVSNLTDRAFRSLCIGDEAVYNDSDLGASSPCFQSDRQRAFSPGGPDGEREEIKRAAQESFSLRMQQYGQNCTQGGMYEAQVHRDPQRGLCGESAQLSATFQHTFAKPSQQEAQPRNTELSCLGNGAAELSLQQRRSHSRVSSLIQAFNTEGYMDGAGSDDRWREWNDQGVWDSSTLMGFQTNLTHFSTSYEQTLNSGRFPPTGPFSFKDPALYLSEMAAVAHVNAEFSFMSSFHSKHSVSTQDNSNSHVFIHSEFSPFRVWKDPNRFPLQHGDVSGFLSCSEFSQWYETPMYKKISMEPQPQGRYRFHERDIGYPRNNFAPAVPPAAFHSAVAQKALSVEKRCESELTGYYPHWRGPESLGANRIPPQRPSTASPATEMSRRVQDTISSVKAYQKQMKMMTEQNPSAGMQTSGNNIIYGKDIQKEVLTGGDSSTTPFSISQLLTPFIDGHQEAATCEVKQHPVSPLPVEHAPVRAESRGVTPDVRTSSYKSRATSLLFNLKDNRKRVKSTYSPNKFKASETLEKSRQPALHEATDTVIDIPDDPEPDIRTSPGDPSEENIVSHQHVKQWYSSGVSGAPFNFQPAKDHRGQCLQNTGLYQTSQTQGPLLPQPGYTGFTAENCTSNQLPNGKTFSEDLLSFTPRKQGTMNNAEHQGGDGHRPRPSYATTETLGRNSHNNQTGEYLISRANPGEHFNETVGRESTKVKHNYSNASPMNRWRQANNQDAENIGLKTAICPLKQEITSLMEKDKHAQESQRAAVIKEELKIQRDGGSRKNQQSRNQETENKELGEKGAKNPSNISTMPAYCQQEQHQVLEDKLTLDHTSYEDERKDLTEKYQDFREQQNSDLSKCECMLVQGGDQRQCNEMQSLQAIAGKPQFKQEMLKTPPSNPDNASSPATANQPESSPARPATAQDKKAQHAQAELAQAQNKAQEEVQLGAETDQIILAEQASSDRTGAGQTKAKVEEHERIQQDHRGRVQDRKMKENQSERSREQQAMAHQTTRAEPKQVAEETGAKHGEKLQGETVNSEQAGTERLKREHMKTDQTSAKQVQTEEKAEQVRESHEREQGEVEQIQMENIQAGQAVAGSRKIEHATGTGEHEKTKADEGEFSPEGRLQPPTTQNGDREKIEAKKAESPRLELAKALLVNSENMLEMYSKPAPKLKTTQQVKSESDKVEQVKTELAKAKAELAKIKGKMREEQKEKARNRAPTKDDGKELLKLNLNKNEAQKHQDGAAQSQHQSQDSAVVSRKNQTNSGADDYERLRQKYGFTNTTSLNNKMTAAAEHVLPSDNSKSRSSSPNEFEMRKAENLEDKYSPKNRSASVNTENKSQVDSSKPNEGTEMHYVYSESSKEFKLSNDFYLLTDKMKDSSVQKLEKCDSPKHVLKQDVSDSVKVLHRDRKNKSAEHSLGPANDLHLSPARSLSHKERAQTKQEILTSKIKAHAEKEISAIKESLAKPDGFLAKTFSKSTGVSRKPELRRSPLQDVTKKHDSNTVRMQQVEPSGAQIKPISQPVLSATAPVQSAATISKLNNPSNVPTEAKGTCTKESETPIQAKQTTICVKEGLDGNHIEKNSPNINSSVKCEEHKLKIKKENEKESHGETPGKQIKTIGEISASTANQLKNNVDLLESNVLVEVKKSKYEPREKAEEDSAPSLKVVLGQSEAPAADDSLQIMGIKVTVRERTAPAVSNEQRESNPDENVHLKETAPSSAETDRYCPSIGVEDDKRLKSRDALHGYSGIRADEDRAGRNIHPETVKERSAGVSENVPEKCTNMQLEKSARPQWEKLFQELLPEEGASCSPLTDVNESHLYKQDMTERETQGEGESKLNGENSTPTVCVKNNFHAEPQFKPDSESSLTEEMIINPPEGVHMCGQRSPLLEEQRHDPKTITSFKKKAPGLVTETENKHTFSEKHMEKDKQEEKVHIDSITIRVLPSEAGSNPDSGHVENSNSFNTEDENKDGAPASGGEESKVSGADKSEDVSLKVKIVPDLLKNSKQQNSLKDEKIASKLKTQPMEGGYFQMQGVIETNVQPESSHNAKDGCKQALSGLKTAAVSADGKNEVFALEQAKKPPLESSSESVEHENMERKTGKTSLNVPSKEDGNPSELQSVRNPQTGVDESAPITAQRRASLSKAEEGQSSQNQFTMSDNVRQEVKTKTRGRTSTIPEISAIADYARLKVIVSEDRENTIQEFPPHKKEGFFPLIQSCHSRRPVFTAEPQTTAVKEKSLPSKPEISAKVTKKPKPVVFPITEKEHQRTGMFKLGDKDKQERNTVATKEKQIDKTQELDECASKTEPQSQQHLQAQPDLKQADREKMNGSPVAKTEEERQERWRQREKEATSKQKTANQTEEAQALRRNVEDETEGVKIKLKIVESRASFAKAEKRAAQREDERRVQEREATAILIKQRQEKQREAERRAEEERRVKQMEEERTKSEQEAVKSMGVDERRAKLKEEERQKIGNEERGNLKKHEEESAAQADHQGKEVQQRFIQEEQQRRAADLEQQRRAAHLEELQRRAAQEERRRRAAYEEQQRRAATRKQHLRAAQLEEQQRQVVQREHRDRAAGNNEQQRGTIKEEQQKRAIELKEQQNRVVTEEQQQRAALVEQRLRSAEEERQKRATREHQIRTAELDEQQRRVAYVEQRRADEFEEEQKRAADQEHQRTVAQLEEQQRRAAEEKQQQPRVANAADCKEHRITSEKVPQKPSATEERQVKTAQLHEQQRRAATEDQPKRAPAEEQHCGTAKVEQQRKTAREEQQQRAAEEKKHQGRAAQREQQTAKEQQPRTAQEEQRRTVLTEQRRPAEANISVGEINTTKIDEEGRETQRSVERNKQIQNEVEHQTEGETDRGQNRGIWMQTQEEAEHRAVHEKQTIIKERDTTEAKVASSNIPGERHSAVKDEKAAGQEQMSDQTDEEKEMFAAYREKERAARTEQQKRAAQLIDALQYYTITSAESERRARERQSSSPVPPQHRNHLPAVQSTEDPHVELYRPQAPSSPAPSLPRSNTSSPALGSKPSMFRVKDISLRGSSFVKSVKPRFHKAFGDDFRVSSPMGSKKVEEEQDALRSSAVTPIPLDTDSNRLAAVKESFPSAHSSQGSSEVFQPPRPYSRRSFALDEDDSRSVFSIMSEDRESFATSATDLADIRALCEHERPESSCSFSSDLSRPLGKPPVVPPKSEKALRRAKRLTTRRIKKELSKAVAEHPPEEGSAMSSSSSAEVQSSSRTAVATPHSSPPVSLAYAPKRGTGLPSPHAEPQSSSPATPHATGAISLPAAPSHAAISLSLPAASPHAIGPLPYASAPKTVANAPSSPTLHHTSHQAPVAKFQFESGYTNSYPLTQRKVLQDIGSGQYFVVDVPVQVKTKTFFDPETGRYVQLNVRESARRTSQPQLQQACPPPLLQPQPVNLQHGPHLQDPPAVKPGVFHQGYRGYQQGSQAADMSSAPRSRSSVPGTLYHDQQPVRGNPRCAPAAGELRQNSQEHYHSLEKTPYMDTVKDIDKIHDSAHSQYGSRDIITMSELEDFMELSDW